MIEKICIGCGQVFYTKTKRKVRCKGNCGRVASAYYQRLKGDPEKWKRKQEQNRRARQNWNLNHGVMPRQRKPKFRPPPFVAGLTLQRLMAGR